jgi:hypothetical protein
MSDNDSQSKDIFGIKPFGDATKIAVEKSLDGAGAFLGKICLPAAEELGLFFKDRVHLWRSYNLAKAEKKAKKKYEEIHGLEEKYAHPRLVSSIVNQVSWTDDDEIQEMWAGLLTSSCTQDGDDDSNLIFINLLAQLNKAQVKILNYACGTARKQMLSTGVVRAQNLTASFDELKQITGIMSFQQLDRDMEHLAVLGLLPVIGWGFQTDSTDAIIRPSDLALHLFVRCQGSVAEPSEYFKDELVPLAE